MGATPVPFEDLAAWRGGEPPGEELDVRLLRGAPLNKRPATYSYRGAPPNLDCRRGASW
ncbi:hypothetical protein BCR34DRAFT_555858 [Clohesyomyces aquaticus]|uniref:Uncharacterized protein n=1 Tax=Clohesyomyces aquaticus TaxID=1231657 RepID=A0A1Y2A4A6_9PLEO|nr:hypothetical protein BCR34DRAFT_555858 [Clohesyomyces aquaticus]